MLHHEYLKRGKYLVAAFNSRGRDSSFEWKRKIAESGNSALHLLDSSRSWYHQSIEEVLDLLTQYKPDVLIGASAGGYAALLFGGLLGIKARAFSPQTTLEDVTWDQRWQDQFEEVRQKTKHPELLDLVALEQSSESHIYFCREVKEDRLHAERLKVPTTARGCNLHEDSTKDIPLGIFD